jgi:hypothetical protein
MTAVYKGGFPTLWTITTVRIPGRLAAAIHIAPAWPPVFRRIF